MYSLVSWVLRQSTATLQAFWGALTKDYNLESYPKLRTLLTTEHTGVCVCVCVCVCGWWLFEEARGRLIILGLRG